MEEAIESLRRRLQAGEVTTGGVRAAALLGEPRARALADLSDLGQVQGLEQVIDCLGGAPREALARVTIALVRAALSPANPEAITAAARWTLCPCPEHARAAEGSGVAFFAAMVAMTRRAMKEAAAWALKLKGAGSDELVAAVRAELVPWLLREGDPLHAAHGASGTSPTAAPEFELRPPKAAAPAPPPVAPPSELASAIDAAIEAGRERELRILRGRDAPPPKEEILAEGLEWLAAALGDGWKALKQKLKRTGGGWTEELTLVKRSLEFDWRHVYLRPERAVLRSGKLAAWRKKVGAPEGSDEVASVPLQGEWDLYDPQEGRQSVAAVAELARTAALARFERVRDPATLVDELVALRGGVVDALALEVVLCHAGREAAARLVEQVGGAPDAALALVMQRHELA